VTFSLVACDLDAGQWGVAVASKFPSVGAAVPWARGGVGAVATQAGMNVQFGPEGLELLASGHSAEQAVSQLVTADDRAGERQLGIVDARGEGATYTGAECLDWAGGHAGPGFAAQGNVLAGPQVVDALAETFLTTGGSLARRMLAALLAADRAGGDRRGRQGAALIVREAGGGYGGNNDILIDLRVDDHIDPVPELGRLLDIHELLFGKTPPDEFLPLEGELASEVEGLLRSRGYQTLDEWASIENLEERLWPDASRIDPVVLQELRKVPGTA
jgi:uncharacterized Ntn-hydrolase superfamily protein